MANESKRTRHVCSEMSKLGAMCIPLIGSKMGMAGLPDRYVVHPQWQGFLEFKAEQTRLRDVQRIVIRNLKLRGAKAYVVRFPYNIEDEEGNLLASWNGTGRDLLLTLIGLERPTESDS